MLVLDLETIWPAVRSKIIGYCVCAAGTSCLMQQLASNTSSRKVSATCCHLYMSVCVSVAHASTADDRHATVHMCREQTTLLLILILTLGTCVILCFFLVLHKFVPLKVFALDLH